MGRIIDRDKDFFSSPPSPDRLWSPGCESDYSPPSSSVVINVWTIHSSPYVFNFAFDFPLLWVTPLLHATPQRTTRDGHR